jgi:hypothetical protein
LDATIWRQYTLARQVLLSFGGEFEFASLGKKIEYKPFDSKADQKAKSNPATYYRQGLPTIRSGVAALAEVRRREFGVPSRIANVERARA